MKTYLANIILRIQKYSQKLDNLTLLIDLKDESYLFSHGFFDENILALKIDGREEYAFLVNETKFDRELSSADRILEFLQRKYIAPELKKQTFEYPYYQPYRFYWNTLKK
jgi:hypothetical protein